MSINLLRSTLDLSGHCTACYKPMSAQDETFEIATEHGRDTRYLALCPACLKRLHELIVMTIGNKTESNQLERDLESHQSYDDLDNVDLLADIPDLELNPLEEAV